MGEVKKAALEIAKELPDDCSWDEFLYRVPVRKQLSAGLKDEAENRLVSHENVFAKYAKN